MGAARNAFLLTWCKGRSGCVLVHSVLVATLHLKRACCGYQLVESRLNFYLNPGNFELPAKHIHT
jgi:hypothetical protein